MLGMVLILNSSKVDGEDMKMDMYNMGREEVCSGISLSGTEHMLEGTDKDSQGICCFGLSLE